MMSELEAARISCSEFVEKIEVDDGFLTVTFKDHGMFSVQLAENRQKCFSSFFGPSGMTGDLKPGSLGSIVTELYEMLETGMRQSSTLSQEDSAYPLARELTEDSGLAMGLIQEDVANFCRKFGSGSAVRLPNDTMDWVELQVPVQSLMSAAVASAWGVRRDAPITIVLKFAGRAYVEDGRSPAVDVFQKKEKFRLGQQMARILKEYLKVHWSAEQGFVPPQCSVGRTAPMLPESGPRPPLTVEKQALLDKLIEMDFELNFAYEAALNSRNIEEAISFKPSGAQPTHTAADSKLTASQFINPESTRYNPATDPEKMVPYCSDLGFLVHVADVVTKRIPSSSRYCVICDKPHIFSSSSMLRSSVCTRDLCVFAFHELKLGSDAAESVATDSGVIDLLLTIFRAAALSSRDHMLDPYPKIVDPTNPSKFALNPEKRDISKIRSILQVLPTTREVIQCEDLVALKERLEAKDNLAYPLLEWVISSNRSHIVKMDPAHLLAGMDSPHQFILIAAAPEKETIFRGYKAKHKTKFAFHGSRAENWHCILRNGLKNMSGTKDQLNGAAHGSGIYFACDANTSIGYSRGTDGTMMKNDGDFLNSNVMCLALCEIIDDGSTIKDHGWCWTVEAEEKVMTRFFFCYNGTKSVAADTKKDEFVKTIRAAMTYYNLE
jgi:hypothetical protein